MWIFIYVLVFVSCTASTILKVNKTTSNAKMDQQFSSLTPERRAYFEDLFDSFKSMDWHDDEQLCLNHTLFFIKSLQNFTLWAASMWEASAIQPQGVLYGSRYQLGNFDECLRPAWSADDDIQLSAQYCLADVHLLVKRRDVPKHNVQFGPYRSALDKIYDNGDKTQRAPDRLVWGACVPAACPPRSVGRLLTALLHRTDLAAAGVRFNVTVDGECQRRGSGHTFPPDTVAFFSFFGILALTAIICTAVHWYYRSQLESNKGPESKAVLAFSMMKNFHSLSRRNGSGLDVLYGIRWLSICCIIISHRYGFMVAGALSNGFVTDQYFDKPLYIKLFLVHNDLAVDTFFFMSGLLVTNSLLSTKSFANCAILILRRYARIAPGLGVGLWYMSSVNEFIGSGPLWRRYVATEIQFCRRNWWHNMLTIGTYVSLDEMCMLTTWYVQCDFHLFLVAVCLCFVARGNRRRLLVIFVALAALSVLVPAFITAQHKLPALMHFYDRLIEGLRTNETYLRMYIPAYARAAPYVLGTGVGDLVSKAYPIATTKKMSMKKSVLLAAFGLLVMLAVMAYGAVFYDQKRPYNAAEAAIYASFNRPVWAIGLTALILACVYGEVPLITSILTWYPWVPLSKLTYGVYILHIFILFPDIWSARNPRLFNPALQIHEAVGDIALSTFFALLLWLLVEAPCINLLNICLATRAKATLAK